MMEFDYIYLSLGAGVQSSALLWLAEHDPEIPTPDEAMRSLLALSRRVAAWGHPAGCSNLFCSK